MIVKDYRVILEDGNTLFLSESDDTVVMENLIAGKSVRMTWAEVGELIVVLQGMWKE